MLDGIDHRLADGNAHPVHRLVVEARQPTEVIADDLHEVHHFEIAVDLQTDRTAAAQHTAPPRAAGPQVWAGAGQTDDTASLEGTRVNNILNRIRSRWRML